MPPHCDSLDGPVVTAARHALAANDVDVVLPNVHADGEPAVQDAFELTAKARALGPEAQDVADRWFFETVVRVHRAGEGAAFTGLKPAGLDVGPVIPVAERALETGDADELVTTLCNVVRTEVERRHSAAMALRAHADRGVPEARAYVVAALELQVWSHTLYVLALAAPHAHAGHEHD
jgi:hypothetical protein